MAKGTALHFSARSLTKPPKAGGEKKKKKNLFEFFNLRIHLPTTVSQFLQQRLGLVHLERGRMER